MTKYYNRVFDITINDKEFIPLTTDKQFRVVFKIIVDFGGAVSYADISIYNLNDDTAKKALKSGDKLAFRAGYVENIDTIFKGSITNVLRERNGSDTITRLICKGYGFPSNKSIEKTLGKNISLTSILKEIADSLELPLVIDDEDFDDTRFLRGYVLHGDPEVKLEKLARNHAFDYVIENERLIIVSNNKARAGRPFIVSEFAGMEGIPEITENGVDVSVRLSPKIKIGGEVDVQSELATFNFGNLYFQNIPESAGKGIYRIYKIEHGGDSYGDEWTSKITGYR